MHFNSKAFPVMASFVAHAAFASPVPAPEIAEAQLRAISHQLADSAVVPNQTFLSELIDDDFVQTSDEGVWRDRSDLLASFGTTRSRVGVPYQGVQVRLFGSVAVTHATYETLADDGKPFKVRYTDVYFWNGSHWRLVSEQSSKLANSVSVAMQTTPAPTHAPWVGFDPKGDETTVLQRLNENYVNAFRQADVAWYDAHLAPDYVVVSSDGSLKDRSAALVDFAKPVFATHIRAFPVDKVKIRRFGDVALIHAENAFEMKDGRKGVNRYTDIWVQQDGTWRCVAAHITTYKPLAQFENGDGMSRANCLCNVFLPLPRATARHMANRWIDLFAGKGLTFGACSPLAAIVVADFLSAVPQWHLSA